MSNRWIDIDLLRPNRNLRIPKWRDLPKTYLDSFKEIGPLTPVVVRQLPHGEFEIIANIETWVAAQHTGHQQVPIEIRDDLNDVLANKIASQRTGSDEDPISQATRYSSRLYIEQLGKPTHGTISDLAREEGVSRSYISHALRLLTLPESVQSLLSQGRITAAHAKIILSVKSKARQVRLAQTAADKRLSVRALKLLAGTAESVTPPEKHVDASGSAMPLETNSDKDVAHLEQTLSEYLGCTVRLDNEVLYIRYQSIEILQGIIDRIGL